MFYSDNDVALRSGSVATVMWKVYAWMSVALAVSAATAFSIFSNTSRFNFFLGNKMVFWGVIIAEFALVILLSAMIKRMSFATAALSFITYAFLSGVTLSVIFAVYNLGSITTVFAVTTCMFAAMALFGYYTKSDLTSFGKILTMLLIGLVISSLINFFLQNAFMDYVMSIIGVFVFTGLTAYDVQKIKDVASHMIYAGEPVQKIAIIGALTLYLDFINLFLYLLRLFGKRRD
jgi:FtsH-binding integral membrane protein